MYDKLCIVRKQLDTLSERLVHVNYITQILTFHIVNKWLHFCTIELICEPRKHKSITQQATLHSMVSQPVH